MDDLDAPASGGPNVALLLGGLACGVLLLGGLVLAGLSVFVGVRVGVEQHAARQARVQSDLTALSKALALYRLNVGAYPADLDALRSPPALDDPTRWRGPYVEGPGPLLDPWGNPYRYEVDADADGRLSQFELFSYGADGLPGGAEADADLYFEGY